MKNKFTTGLILCSLLFTACAYDVEEELYPTVECETVDMSFMNDIEPILLKDCSVCHSAAANFGNVNLEGYDQVKIYVDNGRLMGSINHDSGFSPMPQGSPKLLDCEIEKIEAWISDGALDN